MFKSKRFIAFVVSIVLFIALLFLTDNSPMELAGALGVISTIYIGSQTLRKSSKNEFE